MHEYGEPSAKLSGLGLPLQWMGQGSNKACAGDGPHYEKELDTGQGIRWESALLWAASEYCVGQSLKPSANCVVRLKGARRSTCFGHSAHS